MCRELEIALESLIESGLIRCGVGYSRSDLVPLLGQVSEEPDRLFAKVRGEAGDACVPGAKLSIVVRGSKRGTRYWFASEDAEAPALAPMNHRLKPSFGRQMPASQGAGPQQETMAYAGNSSVTVYYGDNFGVLSGLADESVDLIYVDPPFNTGRVQSRTQIRTERDEDGDRTGFQGRRYRTIRLGTRAYSDVFDDYLGFLEPRLLEAYRVLSRSGSLFLHLDYREVHYAKVLLDQIFGRECFQNEIIWAYDYGARSKSRWSAKHDNILWYSKNPERYTFNFDEIDRIPYMAPGLVGPEKAARGKTPTDVWWHTIVSPNGHEKTGYPTQKPIGVLSRIIKVHSRPGDHIMDFFAGSGSLGEAGAMLGRRVTLVDDNPEAIEVMRKRLARFHPTFVGGDSQDLSEEETGRVETSGTRTTKSSCVSG